jgi:filamentous hemagglutinin
VNDSPRLPRAHDAAIPTDKLVSYALDPGHPRGRHKARVFSAALAIEQTDWRYLHDQLAAGVLDAPVRATRITPFGVVYDVVVLIDGLNGATAPVATIWIVESDRPPRLVSTWVDIP